MKMASAQQVGFLPSDDDAGKVFAVVAAVWLVASIIWWLDD